MAEGDVEIELKDDLAGDPPAGTPAPNGAAPGTDGKPLPDPVSTDIAEVQRKLDESEAGRIAAERRADEATQRAHRIETGAIDDRKAMIDSALATIDANIETLEGQAADFMAAGDFKAAAKCNSQIAQQAAQKPQLLNGKAALEAEGRRPQPTGQLNDNQKLDLYVSTMQPRAAAWIRAHPQYVLDQKMNDKLLARHYSAKEAGHAEGTDGYFRFIEDGLAIPQGNGHAPNPTPAAGGEGGDPPQPLSAAATPTQRRSDPQPSAAAPSRGGGGSRTVRLTPAQQEAARISGQTYQEYAESMERERRAGNIGPKRVH